MTGPSTLTSDQRQHAWKEAYRFNLDLHPDIEIAWEVERWRDLGALPIAAIGDQLLAERRADDFYLPSDTTAQELTALCRRVPEDDVFGWVSCGGFCLLAAIRMVYIYGPFVPVLAS
jgi:hypothetical protein